MRTGREALLAVDCFGNIRIVRLADEPVPDTLYTYEAPLVPRWERPTLGSDLSVSVPVSGCDTLMWSLSGVYTVFYLVRERVRGPPKGACQSSFDFAQDEPLSRCIPVALMLSEVEA